MKIGVVFDQVVGAVLAHYRTKVAELNQQQAVEDTSIGTSSLSRLEKGNYSLSMERLFELSKSLGVSMSEITTSVERTCDNVERSGIHIALEKKANTDILLISMDALSSMVVIDQNNGKGMDLEKRI